MITSRRNGLIAIAVVYVVAIVIGVAVFQALPELHVFWRVLVGDVVATLFVYAAGILLKNTSVYDPYWSVAPIAVLTGLAVKEGGVDVAGVLMLLAVWYWGVRLTLNWAHTFRSLAAQDWRYDKFKRDFPRAYQLVSLFGINLFPTAVVFGCMLPAVVLLQHGGFGALTVVGFALCVGATTLQLVADLQMHRFRAANAGTGRIIRDGVWKHSRHPNYLGEILMWWGVYLMMLPAAPQMWFLFVGPLVNTLMFLLVSIPLGDARNRQVRAGFDEYLAETNSLLPIRGQEVAGPGAAMTAPRGPQRHRAAYAGMRAYVGLSERIKEDTMGAIQPQHSADDAGAEVPTEGFPEGDPLLDDLEKDTEPDQEAAASPESNAYGVHPADDPDLTGEDRFDAG